MNLDLHINRRLDFVFTRKETEAAAERNTSLVALTLTVGPAGSASPSVYEIVREYIEVEALAQEPDRTNVSSHPAMKRGIDHRRCDAILLLDSRYSCL